MGTSRQRARSLKLINIISKYIHYIQVMDDKYNIYKNSFLMFAVITPVVVNHPSSISETGAPGVITLEILLHTFAYLFRLFSFLLVV